MENEKWRMENGKSLALLGSYDAIQEETGRNACPTFP
jgi:hypothetical protein